jgi:hypothetical protein
LFREVSTVVEQQQGWLADLQVGGGTDAGNSDRKPATSKRLACYMSDKRRLQHPDMAALVTAVIYIRRQLSALTQQ